MDRATSLERYLHSLPEEGDFEVLVGDATQPAHDAWHPKVTVVPQPLARSLNEIQNRLIRQSTGSWVLVNSDDLEWRPGSFARLLHYLDHLPQTVGMGLCYFHEPTRDTPCHVSLATANFPVVRRAVGDAVDWFDEGYRSYCSDRDLLFKVLESGSGVVGLKGVCLIHHHVMDDLRERAIKELEDGQTRFFEKWQPKAEWIEQVFQGWHRTELNVLCLDHAKGGEPILAQVEVAVHA